VGIVVLDELTVSKIAAGEVVERPASVVKELLENALDAGARRGEVEIRGGGRELIRVSDDGCGMTREDAVLALQRYATSKIRTADDLAAVNTFGFRGEALPSIGAVSHLTLVTRTSESPSGTRLVAVAGEVVELEETGAPVGTQVSVSRLFFNTPARLKFLKSDTVETGHIVEVVTRFLFSNPEVAFRLTQEGRVVMQGAGSGELRGSVLSAWGRELAEAMLPVELALPGMRVTGLVSGPQAHRGSRNRQFLFVNRRWVRSRALSHAVDEAYRGVLPEGRHAAVVLLVEVEPGAVDVNVHPTKAEVRLSHEWEVHHLVSRAVREALGRAGTAARGELARMGERPAAARPLGGGPAEQGVLPGGWAGTLAAPGVLSPAFQARGGEELELRPLAQLRQTYILAESRQGLLLVDQHRAQERVSYERFTQARLAREGEPGRQATGGQALLSPAAIQVGPREAAVLSQQMEELRALGFDLEPFGSDAFLVRAVPSELARGDVGALIRDIAEELTAEGGESSTEKRRERLLISLSCHSAIKAGDALTYEEMAELLRALAGTARPYTCPHGWPIVMTISNFEIDRKFNR
jgi:DNA mismatch repair protein MutL